MLHPTVMKLPDQKTLAGIILEQIKEMSDGSLSLGDPSIEDSLLNLGMGSLEIAELELELENVYDLPMSRRVYLEKSDNCMGIAFKIQTLKDSGI